MQDAGVGEIASEQRLQTIEMVYRDQSGPLWRALVAYTGNRELASDALGEAFAQLLVRGPGVTDPARWVWRAGFKIAAGGLDRAGRTISVEQLAPPFEPSTERSVDLMRALQQLPRRQRAVLVLHYLVDLPTAEVGRVLEMAAPTVRVHLTQGRRRLRTLMESQDV